MHEGFSEVPHLKFKILKIYLWHTDKSGYLEPLNCEYCNYLADFRILILHILFLGVWFLLLQVAGRKKTFCPKPDLGPGG